MPTGLHVVMKKELVHRTQTYTRVTSVLQWIAVSRHFTINKCTEAQPAKQQCICINVYKYLSKEIPDMGVYVRVCVWNDVNKCLWSLICAPVALPLFRFYGSTNVNKAAK